MKKKTKKQYSVSLDMKYSEGYIIIATSKTEAKKIAWEKFKKRLSRKSFELLVDEWC